MTRILLIAVFVLVNNFTFGQTPKEDSARIEILKLTDEWNQALIKKDSVALDRIVSSDFSLASSNGTLVRRDEWMRNSLHFLFTDSAAFIGPQKVTVYGTEAISEGVLHWKVRNTQNNLRNHESLVADIWRYTDGKWQVTHRMSKLLRKRP